MLRDDPTDNIANYAIPGYQRKEPVVTSFVEFLGPNAVDQATNTEIGRLRRSAAGAGGPCSLAELFHAVRQTVPTLTVPDFHDGLRRLHDTRAVRLCGSSAYPTLRTDPEYAMLVGSELCSFVSR